MKVLYLSLFPDLSRGGQRSLLLLLRALEGKVERLLATPGPGALEDEARQAGVEVIHYELPRLLARGWRVPFAVHRLRRIIREHGVDLVHCDAPRNAHLAALAAPRTARLVHLRVSTPDGFSDRLLASHATRLIAVSNGVAERFSRYPVKVRRKLRVVPNSVNTAQFKPLSQPQRETLRREFGLPADKVLVVLLGAHVQSKRHGFLVDLWTDVAQHLSGEAHLVLAGEDPEGQLPALQAILRDGGQEQSVSFLPFVEQPQNLLGAADLLVLPSSEEGFPRVVVEAAACGLPALVSDLPGVREGVETGRTGLHIDPRSRQDWVEALLGMLRDHPRRQEMGRAARQLVLSRFSAEIHGEAVLRIYREFSSD